MIEGRSRDEDRAAPDTLPHRDLGVGDAGSAAAQRPRSGPDRCRRYRCDRGPKTAPSWTQRETLSGDWDGSRSALEQRGITIKPRLTQFVQGLAAGDGPHGAEYGGKADLLVAADLGKLGLWNGFSMTVHAEANFGTA